jgi:hypothetical protein
MKRSLGLSTGILFGLGLMNPAVSQTMADGTPYDQQLNTITTAVPFLLITPDSRVGAMGDAGVALSADASSMYWNPAKLPFAKNEMEFAVGFTPWLRALVPDINLAYVSAYKKLDKMSAIGFSLRYFSLGNITFTDITGATIREFKPNEFAIDGAYSRKLSERWGISMTGKFIYSNLTGGVQSGGNDTRPGLAGAVDIGGYYLNDDLSLGGKNAELGLGFTVSNIGNKMSYTNSSERDFIPINLRIGQAFTIHADEFNKFTLSTDLYKLLVPTNPIFKLDTNGVPMLDATGAFVFESGKNPDRGVAAGIFGSFTDAPGFALPDESGNLQYDDNGNLIIAKGSKFREEIREINLCLGAEYWYNNQFAVRAGFFYEHPTKGNRQFVSLGAGVKYSIFTLDLSYLVPIQQRHPLANTLKFTLLFSFADLGKDAKKEGA